MSVNVLARLQRRIGDLCPKSRTARALGLIGLAGLVGFFLAGFAAPLLSPYDATETPGLPFQAPSLEHPLGTDDVGHDLLTLLMVGTRASLLVGLLGGGLAIGLGTLVGIGAGLLEGAVGNGLMRGVDVALTLPFLPLIIVATAFAGPGLWTTVVVLGCVLWAQPARELRSQVLSVKEREYVQASEAMGASRLRLGARHVLPAVSPLVVAQFAKAAGTAILLEASISFLGLGDPSSPSWGTILFFAQQRSAFLTDAWLWWVLPAGLAISASVLCFVFVGFAVEDLTRTQPRTGPTRAEDAPELHAGNGSSSVVEARDVTVAYDGAEDPAVDGVDLTVRPGETLAVVGGSGSGKSSLALALVGLLPRSGHVEEGRLELGALKARGVAELRGRRIGLVPQEAMNALNPLMTARAQVAEAIATHDGTPRGTAGEEAEALLGRVGLPGDAHALHPHELSGGMRQRVAIAIALAPRPEVLIADEPTTGLDTVTKVEVLGLLEALQEDQGFALVPVSHDLPAVTKIADRAAVMKDGAIVETLDLNESDPQPRDPFTRELLEARASLRNPPRSGRSNGQATTPVVQAERITKSFPRPGNRKGTDTVLDEVSFQLHRGEVVGLIGRSGAGKSTIGRILAGLAHHDEGRVEIEGRLIEELRDDQRVLGRLVHYLFQDPYGALPPSFRARSIVGEPLEIHEPRPSRYRARVSKALEAAELTPPADYEQRVPGELSGGERQRVALARALALGPSLLIADEPASMLDAPLKEGLLARIREVSDQRGMTTLLITHDVARAATVADRLLVLEEGHIVEAGPTRRVIESPRHAETQRLIAAAKRLADTPNPTPPVRPRSKP